MSAIPNESPVLRKTESPAAPFVDVFIGTKAQYIKVAPFLRLLDEERISYNLIDSGQHAQISSSLRKELGIREPDTVLRSNGNISSILDAAKWFAKYTAITIFRSAYLRNCVFSQTSDYCLIHGDTPTTLLSLLMAKRAGKKVAHLEAGLRSYNLFKPFPEELIRIVCMKFSDILFAPSEWAVENLRKMRVRGEVVNIKQNTNVEALEYSLQNSSQSLVPNTPYCLFTSHRVETIFNKSRMLFIVDLIEEISQSRMVVFVLHEPTRRKLDEFGLTSRLSSMKNVTIQNLVGHGQFLHLLKNARFAVTDGGSIQEESFYLDTPCLLLRSETERQEGLASNVRLSSFDRERVQDFLTKHEDLRTGRPTKNLSPSKIVLAHLKDRSQA